MLSGGGLGSGKRCAIVGGSQTLSGLALHVTLDQRWSTVLTVRIPAGSNSGASTNRFRNHEPSFSSLSLAP